MPPWCWLPIALLAFLVAPATAGGWEPDPPLSLSVPPWPFLATRSYASTEDDRAVLAPSPEGDVPDPEPEAPWLNRAARLCLNECRDTLGRVARDFENMYLSWRLGALGLGVAAAAPLANTDADEHFQNWYRRRAAGGDLADCAKHLGSHWLVLPFILGGAAAGRVCEGTPTGEVLFEWGNRSWRALLVGAPAVGILQAGLGASRPDEHSSRWRPFADKNSVAGHGFVGAVPFLTAAAVARERNCPWLRWAFVGGSFLTTWSRLHHDAHYLSQALLGWWIAYLATDAVGQTDQERRGVHFTTVEYPNGVGAGVVIRY